MDSFVHQVDVLELGKPEYSRKMHVGWKESAKNHCNAAVNVIIEKLPAIHHNFLAVITQTCEICVW